MDVPCFPGTAHTTPLSPPPPPLTSAILIRRPEGITGNAQENADTVLAQRSQCWPGVTPSLSRARGADLLSWSRYIPRWSGWFPSIYEIYQENHQGDLFHKWTSFHSARKIYKNILYYRRAALTALSYPHSYGHIVQRMLSVYTDLKKPNGAQIIFNIKLLNRKVSS